MIRSVRIPPHVVREPEQNEVGLEVSEERFAAEEPRAAAGASQRPAGPPRAALDTAAALGRSIPARERASLVRSSRRLQAD